MKIAANSTLLFIGDSVTDCGRVRPVAEGLFNPHGQGYVNLVYGLLTAAYPERMIRVVNMGVSGNTSRDLLARWKTDALDRNPDWLCLMIGINDVWRQFDVPYMPEAAVPLAEYRANVDKMLASAQKKARGGVVLMSPYYIEPNPADAMRATVDRYRAACAQLAAKRRVIYVDTQAEFDQALKHCHSSYFSWDRVHPNTPGHAILARAFLKAVEYKF